MWYLEIINFLNRGNNGIKDNKKYIAEGYLQTKIVYRKMNEGVYRIFVVKHPFKAGISMAVFYGGEPSVAPSLIINKNK